MTASDPRAVWPALMFLADVAIVLGHSSASAARRWLLREGVPTVRVGRRVAVRAEALRQHLEACETRPEPMPRPSVPPAPPDWARQLLEKGRGRKRGGK